MLVHARQATTTLMTMSTKVVFVVYSLHQAHQRPNHLNRVESEGTRLWSKNLFSGTTIH